MSNAQQDEKIQYLADILSLVAVAGKLAPDAMQRVLASLGNELAAINPPERIDPRLAARLIAEIATHAGEEAAADVAHDITFVAKTWRGVLDEHKPYDPYELLPYAEIIFALVNHTGAALAERKAFELFGGDDLMLPMQQLTAALQIYDVPEAQLTWHLVGFIEPDDQALVGRNESTMYLFKSASSGTALRFSQLELDSQDDTKREHDLTVDKPLFAAFIAGLIGDLLHYAALLRGQAAAGHQVWERLNVLLQADNLDS